jgi:hypothetical protein
MTTYAACPTETVEAPVDFVWRLLTNLSGWGDFFAVRVISVEPPGPAVEGQRLLGESGPRWLHLGVAFEFTRIDELHHQLGLDCRLPLGITVREALDCVSLAGGRCRVNYHCQFDFLAGWRGALLRALLGRELVDGPADSLRRLKRAAERRHHGPNAVERTS